MKAYRGKVTARLLGFWERQDADGPPVGGLTTTYTFDARFFGKQCLARFVGMASEPREDSRADLIEREDRLSQSPRSPAPRRDADWSDIERTLGRTAFRKELAFARKQLRDFARRAPAPPSLRSDVEEALRR